MSLGMWVILIIGFLIGWYFRGVKSKSKIGKAINELRLAEIEVKKAALVAKIEESKAEIDDTLERRIEGKRVGT